MARQRNYRAEYARRKALEVKRSSQQGRAFDLRKARGHTNIARDNARRLYRRLPVQDIEWNALVDQAGNTSWEEIEQGLRDRLKAITEYQRGNPSYGRSLWARRNLNLSDEFYWYHIEGALSQPLVR